MSKLSKRILELNTKLHSSKFLDQPEVDELSLAVVPLAFEVELLEASAKPGLVSAEEYAGIVADLDLADQVKLLAHRCADLGGAVKHVQQLKEEAEAQRDAMKQRLHEVEGALQVLGTACESLDSLVDAAEKMEG